eukprot:CAMPEP_0170356264 /NCGR_PEP_ID=MMETSP0117_2-20130122/1082_1 /TAXON_ID=400756 /ORGANISM="Durinskia baltica, Strain CSIRO CS-38" /LENGTH=99 /DNA_ID=CAMNT_0010610355 /DNA_START=82 /DNA_END=377 /DNA_ORIENTATION=-
MAASPAGRIIKNGKLTWHPRDGKKRLATAAALPEPAKLSRAPWENRAPPRAFGSEGGGGNGVWRGAGAIARARGARGKNVDAVAGDSSVRPGDLPYTGT